MDKQTVSIKGTNKPAVLMCLFKQIFRLVLTIPLFFAFLWGSTSFAESLGDSVPKGDEVKDPHLEKLFAPEFPFETIRIIVAKGEEKYVVIKAKENVTDEVQSRYEKETLRKRKIKITRHYHVKGNTLAFCELTLYRVVSEIPYVVEFSNVKGKQWPGNKADDVLRHVGQYLIISVGDDFAKVFQKVAVYPEKENPCFDPPFVGKYPGSKSIACYEDDKIITFVLTAKAKGQDIYNYYRDKVKKHYKEVGLNFPESKWNIRDMRSPQFGMKMTTIRLSDLGPFLKLMEIVMKQDVTQLYHHGPELKKLTKSSQIPMNGLILSIQINKGDESISDYSFIKIYYSIDADENKRTIEKVNKQYKDSTE
jgi:hypothetical protein